MCGIAGEIRFDGVSPSGRTTAAMADAQAARGPDGAGLWQRDAVALGHRRLAIIDLSEAGAQPMQDLTGELAIAFNGCIYNHRELRTELERAGHRFRSHSDTEVVLEAYRAWGERFVDRLAGMFAFALVDRRADRLLLVRDRLGIKPLYVAGVPGGLRFASTLPALLAGGGVDTSLDPVALHHYLSWHSIVPAPRTVLNGVRKLPPATMRIVEGDGSARDRVYWRPSFTRGAEHDPEEWRAATLAALRTAVERRIVADVPVGVLLSGGVDSSLIVALLAEAGASDLLTFSIGFESVGATAGDEFAYSDAVARRFGTDHHRIRIPTVDIAAAIDPTVAAMSEPMASHDVLAFYLLAQRVAEHVKVVQSGQGADEVFAGYGYYQPLDGVARAEAARAFARTFTDVPSREAMAALAPEFRIDADESTALLERVCGEAGADTALDAVLRLELLTLMPDDPVKRVDNMTMAWGLEARVPFLDHELVELAATVPPELKLAGGGKGLLKEVARPLIGDEVIDRPKGYFPVPALSRLEGQLLDDVVDSMRSPAAKERGLFDPAYVDALLADPDRRFAGSGDRLWLLGVLERWLQAHGIEGR